MKIELDIAPHHETVIVKVCAKEMDDEVMSLLQRLKEEPSHIVANAKEKLIILQPKEVNFFYTENQKVWANTNKGAFEVRQKLYELEESLPKKLFVRISKGVIANTHAMREIEVSFNGSLVVTFKNNHQEVISRRYVNVVKQAIGIGGKQS